MDKQTNGTTIRIEAREKLNDGQPHTIEVKSGKVPFINFTIEKGETAIHIPIDSLFDTIASNLKHFEIAATARAMRTSQRKFFKTRNAQDLETAKRQEKLLDQLLEDEETPKLF